jgi:CBS domain containing-hemolysin-like protein
MYRMGRIPRPGQMVVYQGRQFTVLEMERNRIARVRIQRLPEPQRPAAPSAAG